MKRKSLKLGERVLDGRLNLGQAMDTSGDIIKKRQEVIDGNKNKELANKINNGIADKDAEKTKEMLSEADQALGGNGKVELYDIKEIPAEKMLGEHSADSKDNPGFITNEQGQKPEDKQVFINANPETGTDLTNGSEIMGTLAHEENHRSGRNEVQADLVGGIVEQAWTKENQYNGNTTGSQSPEAQQQTQEDWLARNGNSSTIINGTDAAANVMDLQARTYGGNGIQNYKPAPDQPDEMVDLANSINKTLGRNEVVLLPGAFNQEVKLLDSDKIYQRTSTVKKELDKTLPVALATNPVLAAVDVGLKVVAATSKQVKEKLNDAVNFVNTSAKITNDVSEVALEMANKDQYAKQQAEFILEDIKKNPLGPNEKVNLLLYSGDGQVGLNLAVLLKGKVKFDNVITMGSPVVQFDKSNIGQTTHLISESDDLYKWKLLTPTLLDKDAKIIIYPKSDNITHAKENSYLKSDKVKKDIINIIK